MSKRQIWLTSEETDFAVLLCEHAINLCDHCLGEPKSVTVKHSLRWMRICSQRLKAKLQPPAIAVVPATQAKAEAR